MPTILLNFSYDLKLMDEKQEQAREQHLQLLDECVQDAKYIAIKHGINQEDVIATLAAALFRERVDDSKVL